jgi:hypothetical protein
MKTTSNLLIKLGLLLVALSWFSYTLYTFALGSIHQIVIFTDMPATVGLGFRTSAGIIAVITILFHLVKKDVAAQETLTSLRWVVLLEALYYVTFVPSAIWGLTTEFELYPRELLLTSTGLPCLLEAVIIPLVLTKLFLELSPEKPIGGIIKWGWISGVVYILVFWFNYTMQWIAAIIQKGVGFVTLYPINAFSFALTAVGLFLLTLYATVSFREISGKNALTRVELKRAGVIITLFGLYFDLTFLLWLLFGSVGGYNMWHTFFIFHNVDLWSLALPLAGLPLLLQKSN